MIMTLSPCFTAEAALDTHPAATPIDEADAVERAAIAAAGAVAITGAAVTAVVAVAALRSRTVAQHVAAVAHHLRPRWDLVESRSLAVLVIGSARPRRLSREAPVKFTRRLAVVVLRYPICYN